MEGRSTPECPVTWTVRAERSFDELLLFIGAQPYGNPVARGREIRAAIKQLRFAPEMGSVQQLRNGKQYRRLIVKKRFLIFYLYFPAHTANRWGRVSIRAVKHASRKRPFSGVREPYALQYRVR